MREQNVEITLQKAISVPVLNESGSKPDENDPLLVPLEYLGKPLPKITPDMRVIIQTDMQTSPAAWSEAVNLDPGRDWNDDAVAELWIERHAEAFAQVWDKYVVETVH
jgi:hypothetical protein